MFICVHPWPNLLLLVGLGGLEPPTSSLSGMRSSQLSYRPNSPRFSFWWSWSGSNRRPPECKSGALPAELQPLFGRQRLPALPPYVSIEASWIQKPQAKLMVFRKNCRTLSGDPERAHPPGLFPPLAESSRAPLMNGLEWNGCSLLT